MPNLRDHLHSVAPLLTLAHSSLARYIGVGALSYALNLGLTAVGHEWLRLPPPTSFAVALGTTFVVNFLLARHFVFRASAGSIRGQVLGHAATSLGFRGGEFLLFAGLHALLPVHYVGVAALALACSFLVKFVVYRRFVFVSR